MGSLRIIAGELKGRRLRVPPGLDVRPTADRVREALFNVLGETVARTAVLDPFAGSGALGFEAVSRAARSVTFVESERRVLDCLRRNAAELGVTGRCRILAGRAERILEQGGIGEPFDLVLADPPYSRPAAPLLAALERPGLLERGATVVLERDRREEPESPASSALKLIDSRFYGRVRLDLYRA